MLLRNPVEVTIAQVQSSSDSISIDKDQVKQLLPTLTYLEKGSLPEDKKQAKQQLLERSQFDPTDGVLHYEDQ